MVEEEEDLEEHDPDYDSDDSDAAELKKTKRLHASISTAFF